MDDIISVVVSVYNIERYIERCVKSIMDQTYTNLQIILVDDGSTDSSGKVCDELKGKDNRIEVIHKRNGGASTARNCGLEKAYGEYIAFVDGDDYIDADMYEMLYKIIRDNNADIASCGFYDEFEDRVNIRCLNQTSKVLDKMEAYRALFGDKLGITCCNKLFRKRIMENIKFRNDIIYGEDMEFIYRVINEAQRIVCLNHAKYHYCHRSGSVTTRPFSRKSMDIIYTINNIVDFIRQNYPQIVDYAHAYQAEWLVNHYRWLCKSDNKNEFWVEKKSIEKMIKDNMRQYKNNKHLHWVYYTLLWAVIIHMFPLTNWVLESAIKLKGKLIVRNAKII